MPPHQRCSLMTSEEDGRKHNFEQSQAEAAMTRAKPAEQKFQRMPALDGIRYIAAVHIFARHYLSQSHWQWLSNVGLWGNSATPWFMMLSGFGLAIAYGRREKLPWGTFMIGRLSKLYPLYCSGIILSFALRARVQPIPWAAFITLMLCMSGYVQTAFHNTINSPAHAIGGMVTLYAVFPGAVKMLKGCTTRQLCYVIQPTLWLLTAATVLIDHNYNFGILHPVMRVAHRTRLFNFLQGVVLGLCYTDHDWSRHPKVLQYVGFSVSFVAYWSIVYNVKHRMVGWMPQLGRVSLLTPLQLCMIWYGARGLDPLCHVLGSSFFQLLGGTAYGVCIFQMPFVKLFVKAQRYMAMHQWIVLPKGSPAKPILLIATLTIFSHYTTRAIMLPAASVVSKVLNGAVGCCEGGVCTRMYNATLRGLGDTTVGRALCLLAFVAFYTFYVNWQPCVAIECLGTQLKHPPRMCSHRWFSHHDLAGVLNWYGIPCDRHQLLPTSITDHLPVLTAALICILPVAAGALMLMQSDQDEKVVSADGAATPQGLIFRLLRTPEDDLETVTEAREHLQTLADELKESVEGPTDVQVDVKSSTAADCVNDDTDVGLEEEGVLLTTRSSHGGHCPDGAGREEVEGGGVVGDAAIITVSSRIRLTAASVQDMLAQTASCPKPVAFEAGVAASCLGLGSVAQLFLTSPANGCEVVVVSGTESRGTSTGDADAISSAVTSGHVTSNIHLAAITINPLTHPKASSTTVARHIKRRWAWVRSQRTHASHAQRRVLAMWLALEAGCHLAFVTSLTYLIATPVHEEYTAGSYGRKADGFDCTNGKGTGLSPWRVVLALYAAAYTGAYLRGLLRACSPSEGLLWFSMLLTVMLFLLPYVAALQLVSSSAFGAYLLLAN